MAEDARGRPGPQDAPISVNNPAYYAYYGTLALYQHQGPVWGDWNDRLKETLPRLQNKNGSDAGSWDKGAGHAASGGRVVSTTLATLSLGSVLPSFADVRLS